MSEFVNWVDIGRGVIELVVDEAQLAFHAVFDQMRSPTPSEHFREPTTPYPIHLNRWEDEEYDLPNDVA